MPPRNEAVNAAMHPRPAELRHGSVWRDAGFFARLIGRYLRVEPLWGSALLAFGILPSLATGYFGVRVSVLVGSLTDALIRRSHGAVASALSGIFLILFGLMFIEGLMYGAQYIFRIRWRTIMTRALLQRWMLDNRFYYLQRLESVDNPEQRIQEDLFLIAEQITTLAPSLLTGMATLTFSAGLLWTLSYPLPLHGFGLSLTIPKAMLTAAMLLGIVWTVGAHYVGRAITRIEVARQRLEADFRFGIGQVRENGEAIAFERGARREQSRLLDLFNLICVNWRSFTIAQLRLTVFNILVGSISVRLLPIAMSVPYILSGRMTVGKLTIVTQTFAMVVSALTFAAAYYAQIAALRAAVARLQLFEHELDRPLTRGLIVTRDDTLVALRDVVLKRPDGKKLLEIDDLTVRKGDRILVRGRSGIGKSTVLRAIAGLWGYGSGTVSAPAPTRMQFLPQHSFMPNGTLAELLTYPELPVPANRPHYVAMLERLSLPELADRLDESAQWSQILSPGEQQRIGLARVLLRRPEFVFLDEATSALDIELETDAYRALREMLPNAAIVSVAHRPTVAPYHSRVIDIEAAGVRQSTLAGGR